MTSEPVIARGVGWLGMPGAERGLSCQQGGPHHMGMGGDTDCLDCGKARPRQLIERHHPMRAEIRAALATRDRRAGNE